MQERNNSKYMYRLNINGLTGRMLKMPSSKNKKREILIVPGHHTSIERMYGVAEYVSQYGVVTIPDLPGFGGMKSFYSIGLDASLDNYADYLASFIKLRYKKQKFTIAGLSMGFVVVTRMLQKYPDIARRVDLLVSLAGFAHKDDFKWKKGTLRLFKIAAWVLSRKFASAFVQSILLKKPFIKLAYKIVENNHGKLRDSSKEEKSKRINFEVKLWQNNDIRSQMATTRFMLNLDLTNKHVALPVYHLAADEDRYFDHVSVEQHMRKIFTDYKLIVPDAKFHGPTVIADADEVKQFLPLKLRKILSKDPE